MTPAAKAELWDKVLPALERAWVAYEHLHGVPAYSWEEQERALLDVAPRLYQSYLLGITPAQEHALACTGLKGAVDAYVKKWGAAVTAQDLKDHLLGRP